ncbi:MAG TPA: hypothetical protein VE548_12195 [Nitrososphaeraceae archaeon]|nr:hypothetical protein [Nitrososphaeraceae archaeon]
MNKPTITAITSIVFVLMLCIGIGIVMIPPIVFEAFYSYSSDNEAIIEEVTNSPLMMSMLPTLASVLLILGLIGLGVHNLWKNRLSSSIDKH